MSTQAVTKRSEISSVANVLEQMKPQLAAALPAHITPDRMVRVALTAIQNNSKLLECDRNSFYLALLRSAQLGLEPDGILGQAYLIPFAGKVQLIAGYKGLIDLARRSGEVSNIIAKEVCQGDEFTVDYSLEVPFVHKPRLDGARGEVTHFWAMARFKDGGFHWDYMTRDEVIAIRDRSQGWKMSLKFAKRDASNNLIEVNSPWFTDFLEMGKKTVIRRIAKYLPMSVQRAAKMDELYDSGKRFHTTDMGDIVIEGEATDEGGNVEPKAGKLDAFAGNPETTVIDAEIITPPAEDWQPRVIDPTKNGKNNWPNFASDMTVAAQGASTLAEYNRQLTANMASMALMEKENSALFKALRADLDKVHDELVKLEAPRV